MGRMDRIFFILFVFVEDRFVKGNMDGQDKQDFFLFLSCLSCPSMFN